MASKDPSTSPQEQEISLHYQSGATELPSPLIDQQILQQAKNALKETKPDADSVKHIRPKAWRKWQWSGSIAASVLLVSFIYMFNQPYYQGADLVADEQYFDSLAGAKRQAVEAENTRQLQAKQELQINARSEKNTDDIVHAISTDHVQDSLSSKLLMNEQVSSFANEEKNLSETEPLIEDFVLSAPVQKNLAPEKNNKADNFANNERDKSLIDYQYLDSLLKKLIAERQKMDSSQRDLDFVEPILTGQESQINKGNNAFAGHEIQLELYEILLGYKKRNPKFLVPQKYLNVFNQEQLQELEKISEALVPEQIKK